MHNAIEFMPSEISKHDTQSRRAETQNTGYLLRETAGQKGSFCGCS